MLRCSIPTERNCSIVHRKINYFTINVYARMFDKLVFPYMVEYLAENVKCFELCYVEWAIKSEALKFSIA